MNNTHFSYVHCWSTISNWLLSYVFWYVHVYLMADLNPGAASSECYLAIPLMLLYFVSGDAFIAYLVCAHPNVLWLLQFSQYFLCTCCISVLSGSYPLWSLFGSALNCLSSTIYITFSCFVQFLTPHVHPIDVKFDACSSIRGQN
jgi:hypothetical protein